VAILPDMHEELLVSFTEIMQSRLPAIGRRKALLRAAILSFLGSDCAAVAAPDAGTAKLLR
jgi:hypothetical protein